MRVAAQQQVEIAKALTFNARLLILDEPTAALGGEETELLFEQIAGSRAEGMSFIYISHRLEEIAPHRRPHRGHARRPGGRAATIVPPCRSARLVEQMVGRSVERMFPQPSPIRVSGPHFG